MSLNFTEEGIRRLPDPIVQKLQALIRRVRAVIMLKGAFATVALTIGTVIAIMMLYAAVPFLPDWVGYLGSLAVLGVLLYSAWRFLYVPLSRKLNLADIARLVEQRHPELQERISTSVELLASDDPTEMKGSEQLIRMVVREAISDVSTVRPEEEFTRRKARPFIIASASLVGLLVLSFVIWPKLSPRLFARVLAPYANIGNMYAGMLKVEPGDQVVLKGDSLNIRVDIDRPRVRRTELRMQREGTDEVIERMTRSDESDTEHSVFSIYFPSVVETFTYRVRSMKAESADYTVKVIEAPAIKALTVAADYPEYTGLPDMMRTNRSENIMAPVGTQLSFHAVYNKKVKFSTMVLDKEMIGEGVVEKSEATWVVPVKPGMDAAWKITLEDQYGHANRAEERMITAKPDRAPEITIQKPEDTKLRLQPTELLPLDYFVQDDYGVSEVELHLDFDGNKQAPVTQTLPARLAGNSQPIWTARVMVDLASLDLDGVRQVRAHLLVRDNLPGAFDGPQEGTSRTLVIDIDRTAQSLAEQANEQQKREVEEALKQILERLNRARESSHHAPTWVKENDGLPEWMLDHLKRGHKELSAADAGLKQLAEEVVETPYASMAAELTDIAKWNTTPAKNAVELMQLTDIKSERMDYADELKLQTQIAINRVLELLNMKDELAEKAEELAELTDLAKEEFQLASEAEQLAEEQAEKSEAAEQNASDLAEWQKDQQRLANELGDLLQENQEALAEQLAQDAETASELAEQANELSELQETISELSEQLDDPGTSEEALAEAIQKALQEVQEQIGEDAAEIGEQLEQLSEASQPSEAASDTPNQEGDEPPQTPQGNASDPASQEQSEQFDQASDALESASESAQEAAEDIGQNDLQDAIENAGEVSEQLQQANESLNPQSENAPGESPQAEPPSSESPQGQESSESPPAGSPQEPSASESPSNPQAEQLSEDIGDLLEEQQSVQDALEALEEGNLGEALSALQEAVESQVGELSEAAEAFAAQQEALDNQSAEGLAEEGAELAGEASEALAEAGEPAAGEPSAGEPSAGEPSAGEPSAGEPSAGEPSAGEPSAGEPSAGEPSAGEPSAGEPSAGEPSAGEPSAGEPSAGEPSAAEPSAGEPSAGEPSAGEPSAGEPSAGEPSAGQPSPGSPPSSEAAAAASEALAGAADAFEQLEELLSGQAEQLAASAQPSDALADGSQLSESLGQAAEAASAPSAEAAAQAAQAAAQSLAEAANAAAQSLGMQSAPGLPSNAPGQPGPPAPGQPGQLAQQPGGMEPSELGASPDVASVQVPEFLARMGLSTADWMKMRALGANDIEVSAMADVPEEYRELVNKYFREVARQSVKK